jgi:ATP-dependent 26S proteasome regulatory subunit
LVIPQSLRENLQAYCRILRDYKAYQEVGVHLPKGLLFYGPPGCGKTQIAKTLATEVGLNFVALSTSDCKAMWIGWRKFSKERREKQPSLIFIANGQMEPSAGHKSPGSPGVDDPVKERT